MAPKSDKSFAKATTKLGLATTIAALWLTAVPITGAVANEQISAACGFRRLRTPVPIESGQ